MKKLIVCDGDSWTSGDMIDPNLDITHVNTKMIVIDYQKFLQTWPNLLQMFKITANGSNGIQEGNYLYCLILKNMNLMSYLHNRLEFGERKDFYYKGLGRWRHCITTT